MSVALSVRKTTTAILSTMRGVLGEASFHREKRTFVVHDGSTPGGFPLAREEFRSIAELANSAETEWPEGWHVMAEGQRFQVAPIDAINHDLETLGSVKLYAQSDALGRYAAQQFRVQPAIAAPSPAENAVRFQAWIDAHPVYATVSLPNWEIPLGAGINFGARNVEGQGDASVLNFQGVPEDQDLVTISGGVSGGGIGQRGGRITGVTLECNGEGRDAIRWVGGLGCGAFGVSVKSAGRDAFHFEQDVYNHYFERAFLDQCNVSSAGRYGLCLALAPFGDNDAQFINKSDFANSKLVGCDAADVALLLHDNETVGNGTKIGGGVLFRNFHAQYGGASADRIDGSILISRGADSNASVDWLEFVSSTFESQGSGAGAPVSNRGLVVEDSSTIATRPVLSEFFDRGTLLTGYTRWWDYNGPAPVSGTYSVEVPLQGTYTNDSGREFGTRKDAAGTLNVPTGGSAQLFDAGQTGPVWEVTARAAGNAGNRVTAIVWGHATPQIDQIAQAGNLSLQANGTMIEAVNAGGSSMGIYWSVRRSVL